MKLLNRFLIRYLIPPRGAEWCCLSLTLMTPLCPSRHELPHTPSTPSRFCSAAAEGRSDIQAREGRQTEAFWWCNWQQMWRTIEIKEKGIQNNIGLGMHRGVITSTGGIVFWLLSHWFITGTPVLSSHGGMGYGNLTFLCNSGSDIEQTHCSISERGP